MISFKKPLLIIAFSGLSAIALAQQADVNDLVKQGIEFNNQKNYTAAIDKYKQALAAEPDNPKANYQMAFTLIASGKGTDGIPYLNSAIKSNSNYTVPAYELLGNIYDGSNQPQQAIAAYKEGINVKPDYQPLYYDLGLTLFRTNQFANAEQAAIQAIKLDPKHAYSQRLYALVTFHQNKRIQALMGFCSFLLLSPDDALAGGAYNNIQSLLKGGLLKTEAANTDAETIALNKTLNMAVASVNANKALTGPAQLEAQLKSVFDAIGKLSAQQTDKDFFWNYYADFFYQLSQTEHMPAFARLIGLSGNKAVNAKWLQDNVAKRKALDAWVTGAERKFE